MSSRTKEFSYSNFGQRHFENGILEEEKKKTFLAYLQKYR